MIDEESIRGYQTPTPKIESVDGDHLSAFCGDDIPALGSAVAIESETEETRYAVVERHSGARRIDLWLPGAPDWVQAGTPIRPTHKPAGFARPQSESLTTGADLFRPLQEGDIVLWPDAPKMMELDGKRPALILGIDALDTLAPIAGGGVNLVINAADDAEIFSRLARRTLAEIEPATSLLATSSDVTPDPETKAFRIDPSASLHDNIAALQVVIALGAALRHSGTSVALVDLPRLRQTGYEPPDLSAPAFGLPQIIDRLGRHLVSTTDGSITTILHLRIADELQGLSDIIETLNLGDVDSLIYIDSHGRFDPERSTSRADIDDATATRRHNYLQTLSLARRAREKSAIFGEHDLDPAEKKALETVEALRPKL